MLKQHDLDIYPVKLSFVTSIKALKSLDYPYTDDPTSVGLTLTFSRKDSETFHVVLYVDTKWCDKQANPTLELATTAAHEAAHAAGFILDRMGESYDGHSEANAYLVEWLVDWMLRDLI